MKCLFICSKLLLYFSGMFSSYRPDIFLEFILKYFIFLMFLGMETSLLFSIIHYCVYIQSTEYCLLISYPAILLNSVYLGVLLLLRPLDFQCILSTVCSGNSFLSSFPVSAVSNYSLLTECGSWFCQYNATQQWT